GEKRRGGGSPYDQNDGEHRHDPCAHHHNFSMSYAQSVMNVYGAGRGAPRELSRGEIDEFLRGQRIARLGCHADGVTYVVPLIYAYDDGAGVGVAAEGRKNDT